MNGFDIALLIVASVLAVTGFVKGLIRILVGFVALIAAFLLASQFHGPVAARLGWMNLSQPVLLLIAYAVIFVGVMLAGAVVGYLVRRLLRAAMLGWVDRLGGAALGLATATLMAALLVLPLIAYTETGNAMLRRSVLAPYVAGVADLAAPLVPEGLAELYDRRIEELREYWRTGVFDGIRGA